MLFRNAETAAEGFALVLDSVVCHHCHRQLSHYQRCVQKHWWKIEVAYRNANILIAMLPGLKTNASAIIQLSRKMVESCFCTKLTQLACCRQSWYNRAGLHSPQGFISLQFYSPIIIFLPDRKTHCYQVQWDLSVFTASVCWRLYLFFTCVVCMSLVCTYVVCLLTIWLSIACMSVVSAPAVWIPVACMPACPSAAFTGYPFRCRLLCVIPGPKSSVTFC